MEEHKKDIANEYKEFVDVANELAEKDMAQSPLAKQKQQGDRFEEYLFGMIQRDKVEKHLIGMIELYQIRYGDPETRLAIVNYIECNLFKDIMPSKEWEVIKKKILSNEYIATEPNH